MKKNKKIAFLSVIPILILSSCQLEFDSSVKANNINLVNNILSFDVDYNNPIYNFTSVYNIEIYAKKKDTFKYYVNNSCQEFKDINLTNCFDIKTNNNYVAIDLTKELSEVLTTYWMQSNKLVDVSVPEDINYRSYLMFKVSNYDLSSSYEFTISDVDSVYLNIKEIVW